MKIFKFRLESVLALRERAEEKAKEEYGVALQALALAQQSLQDAIGLRDELSMAFVERQRRGIQPAEHCIFWRALEQWEEECRRRKEVAHKAVMETEGKREAMIEARRNHEKLLRLKTRQQQVHQDAAIRQEENMIDDIVGARYAARLQGRMP